MKNTLYILSCFCFLLLSSCKTSKDLSDLNNDDIRFSLSKGACFGKCPVYTLTIYQNRLAVFEGINFTNKQGVHQRTIAKKEFKRLEKLFSSSNFDKFQKEYKSDLVDLPMIRIGYHNGKNYLESKGRFNLPDELTLLQFELEKIADKDGWQMTKSPKEVNDNTKPDVVLIKEEVIIEPQPGLLMAKWIDSNQDIGVRLIKKIAPGLNYYLITYDSTKISGDDFLKLLKEDKQIIKAEFNKKTSQRGQ